MGRREGFSLVELAVVVAIIGILLFIGGLTFRNAQRDSRDRERAADVEAIATYLETIYPKEIKIGDEVIKPANQYPSRDVFDKLPGANVSDNNKFDTVFGSLESSALVSPRMSVGELSLIADTNNINHETVKRNDVEPRHKLNSRDYYIYRAESSRNQIGARSCEGNMVCRSFTIYYRTEGDYNFYGVVRSKRR